MKTEEVEKILKTLNETERNVYRLRWYMTVEEAAEKIDKSASFIYNKVNPNIFRAFGVKNWDELVEKVREDPEAVIPAEKEKAKITEETVDKISGVEASKEPPVKEGRVEPIEEAPKKKLPWYFVAIPIFIVLIFLFWFFLKSIFPRTVVLSNASTQTSTAASIVYIDTQKTTVAPSNTTNTQIPQATSTPPLSITPTNTITPAPTPVILFSDDFENGLSPYWIPLLGKAFVTNGQLATNEATWLAVGDPTWTNIEIDYDAYFSAHADCFTDPFPLRYYTVMVGLRFQDLENMVALKTGAGTFCWFIATNGNWESAPGSGPGPSYLVWSKISILVEGDKFTVYVNGKKSTSFVDSTYQTGKVAILLNKETIIDNFKIIALP